VKDARMILIGQYDSPFVRRVGIALALYGIGFEHRPWSTFGDAEKLRPFNPLTRVPTLVLADGTALVESHAILDHLDSLVPPARAMFPRAEPARHRALRVASLATGLADKAVSLFYEKRLHAAVSDLWVARCHAQIHATAAVLEAERAAAASPWWFGEAIGHADVAVACMLRFVAEAHPGLLDASGYPALMAHAARAEALPAFQAIAQPFIPPAG
jgi:glutathione S-transferase